jgi:hypothetical protein
MTNCPRCFQPLRRSTGGGGLSADLPDGAVVLACTNCRQFMVEGADQWLNGGASLHDALKMQAGVPVPAKETEAEKEERQREFDRIVAEDPFDPRLWD